MFSTVVEYTGALLADQPSVKYSPIEVAQWIEDCTSASRAALDEASRRSRSRTSPEFRRIEEDVLIQIGLGTFFAHKLRSAVLFEIWQQTGDVEAGTLATAQYQTARDAWAAMGARAARVYRSNVSYGSVPKRRGHWSDRLAGIDTDLAAMRTKVQGAPAAAPTGQNVAKAMRAATNRTRRPGAQGAHTPADLFEPGQPLSLSLGIAPAAAVPTSVSLCYRHVNQAERWKSAAMSGQGGHFSGAIPAEYTHSEYPLQYYFELKDEEGSTWLYPGFNETLSNQPYFAVYKRMT
jgi:hypothetical protein